MTDSHLPTESISSGERQRAVDRLCVHFARDDIDTNELERRLDLAYAARTQEELAALEKDLPALREETSSATARTPEVAPSPEIDPTAVAKDNDYIAAIMGGSERKGHWVPPKRLTCLALMGGLGLDFREAIFATSEVRVRLFALMGGAEILVPPGVRVEWNGVAIMGGIGSGDRTPAGPDAPLISINGLVLMGGLDIVERLPGESAREAKKRLKAERKAARQLPPSKRD